MARTKKSLTARGAQYEKQIGRHADAACQGLYLQVQEGVGGSIRRSWLFRYTKPGTKTRVELGLGVVGDVSLDKARDLVKAHRAVLNDGEDPKTIRDRKAQHRQEALTFEQCAEKYIESRKAGWKNAKHAQQWTNTLKTYAYPKLKDLLPKDIDTALVEEVLKPIWTTKTETASRLRQRIEAILGWATVQKMRSGPNPARWHNHLDNLLANLPKSKRIKHQPSIPYEQINSFVKALRSRPSTSALALEFLLLTATRTGEVIGACWSEIDLKQKLWQIPAERMKSGKAHTVPLNDRAVAILNQQYELRQSEYVFTVVIRGKTKPLSTGAMLMLMRGMKDYTEYVPHGLRSSFRDWGSEVSGHANETLELALAHSIKSSSERAYRRGDRLEKRRELMADWLRYVETPVSISS
jgi:integrase